MGGGIKTPFFWSWRINEIVSVGEYKILTIEIKFKTKIMVYVVYWLCHIQWCLDLQAWRPEDIEVSLKGLPRVSRKVALFSVACKMKATAFISLYIFIFSYFGVYWREDLGTDLVKVGC